VASSSVTPWKSENQSVVPDTLSDPRQISSRALQLRDRERNQLAENFVGGNYEIASTYVWTRAMALLKRQLGSLGAEFIGELLQRPEIDESSDVTIAISDREAISLALDLGVITPLQAKRLFHSQEIVTYFASLSNDLPGNEEEVMTQEEAISCLRVCVQGVLGQENIGAAEDFKQFRNKLTSETLLHDSRELEKLRGSPYFFVKTALGVLLSLFKTARGAQLEHAARNALLIIPEFWPKLKEPERWQIGLAYAEEYNEGRKQSLKGLHSVLLKVSGFDYVPENLRSSTFMKVANDVISAHEGMNNFYNEPAPMRELMKLGTSIPGPALATCITAVLCVKLGNRYGRSNAAQASADELINGISDDRWIHYFDGRLEDDRRILFKLDEAGPQAHWIKLIEKLNIDTDLVQSKQIRRLLVATLKGDKPQISAIASSLYQKAIGAR
jgi:hypothetical protein